jgi:Uma2 family endonuclease
MALFIDDAYLPATLSSPPMTDEEFAEFCSEHPDLRIEMTAEGELILMAPTHSRTGLRNSQINRQLADWAEKDGRGGVLDSSAGFVLPNGARRSPDASWVLNSRMADADQGEEDSYWHLCPDFVIELRSSSDRPPALRKKMREYLANGAQLGWLIDPTTRSVTVFRPNTVPEIHRDIFSIEGQAPIEGFVLDLAKVWDPLRRHQTS